MRILIIDDEDDIRCIARLSLAGVGGMEVSEASSGADGVLKAAAERPDAVLLDMMMPVMDGPATLRALREDPRTAGIPVVFLTAKAFSEEVARLKQLGARGVLTKPFDPLRLPSLLSDLLQAD